MDYEALTCEEIFELDDDRIESNDNLVKEVGLLPDSNVKEEKITKDSDLKDSSEQKLKESSDNTSKTTENKNEIKKKSKQKGKKGAKPASHSTGIQESETSNAEKELAIESNKEKTPVADMNMKDLQQNTADDTNKEANESVQAEKDLVKGRTDGNELKVPTNELNLTDDIDREKTPINAGSLIDSEIPEISNKEDVKKQLPGEAGSMD